MPLLLSTLCKLVSTTVANLWKGDTCDCLEIKRSLDYFSLICPWLWTTTLKQYHMSSQEIAKVFFIATWSTQSRIYAIQRKKKNSNCSSSAWTPSVHSGEKRVKRKKFNHMVHDNTINTLYQCQPLTNKFLAAPSPEKKHRQLA